MNKEIPWQFSTTGIVLSYFVAFILMLMMLNFTSIDGALIFLNIGHIGMLSLPFLALPIIALYGNYVYKNNLKTVILEKAYNIILIISCITIVIVGIVIMVRAFNYLGGVL